MSNKLTEKDTINRIILKTPINTYERYHISDLTICKAFEHNDINFINFISQQKIIFPQVALLIAILKMDVSLCDLCLSYGCKVDNNCVKVALAILNVEMVEYCINHGAIPSKENINLLFSEDAKYLGKLHDQDYTNNDSFTVYAIQTVHYITVYFILFKDFDYSLFDKYQKIIRGDLDANFYADKCKIKNTINRKRSECINYLIEKNLVDNNIIQKSINFNVHVNEKLLTNLECENYDIIMCKKNCNNSTELKDLLKVLKKNIKKKKFTKEMAECISSNHSCNTKIISDLIQIDDINKNKEIMEIFLKNINDLVLLEKILKIKHDYSKSILNDVLEQSINEPLRLNLVKILVEEYDAKIEKNGIEYCLTPIGKYLVEKKRIKICLHDEMIV